MINRLSHAHVAVTDLERARRFYVDTLGLVLHADSSEALWLRAPDEFDVWSLKLSLDREAGLLAFGFRVDADERLDELAAIHRSRGSSHRWLAAGEDPGRGRTLRVRAPGGHVVDFEHAIEEVELYDGTAPRLPMRHTHRRRSIAPARLDHVNVRVPDVAGALDYWQGVLRFSASEIQVDERGETQRAWLRRAAGSHDMAIGRGEASGFHHVAYAVHDAQALVGLADVVSDAGRGLVEYGPGRHGITNAHFLYVRDPDGNRIELYAGDYLRDLDRPPITWTLQEYESQGLLWWGQAPPASFLAAGAVLERGFVDPASENARVSS